MIPLNLAHNASGLTYPPITEFMWQSTKQTRMCGCSEGFITSVTHTNKHTHTGVDSHAHSSSLIVTLTLAQDTNWKTVNNNTDSILQYKVYKESIFYYLEAHILKSVPCLVIGHLLRGQRTLAWTWPDQTLAGQELTDRQAQLPITVGRGQRAALVSECPGQLERPYCKKLVLNRALGKDTGYYRCYYKDAKVIVDRTTAVSVYVFVGGESQSHQYTHMPVYCCEDTHWHNTFHSTLH